MGKDIDQPTPQQNPYAKQLAKIASELFKETDPLRQNLTSQFEGMTGPDGLVFSPVTTDNISQSPLYGALKDINESQFDLSQDRIMEMLPAGGSLNKGLIDNERARAGQFTGQLGALAENEQARRNMLLGQGLGLASGGGTGALSGYGQAGSLYAASQAQAAALANSQAQLDAGKAGGAGELVGTLGSAAIKKCWIAREVYGEFNPRWIVFFYWKEKHAPLWLRFMYNTFGRFIANRIRGHDRARSLIRSWMDRKIEGYLHGR